MQDYATLLLEAKKHLKEFENAMLKRDAKKAIEHAHSLAVEARLLSHTVREFI